ncbi:VWA domain-containing protein [Altibacter sp.]|uniref:nitric oxide reductase activation protein NorD n=1 Tax=Altibacter sp. TaxID=2024823 RepID=UPI000C8F48EA|nr:VWA domain-containing protein [Altibacter sp.]MAP55073.1 NorD protein [Altibacter sp.]
MFEPDEFLFSKVAKFLKTRKKNAKDSIAYAVKLEEIKPRLALIARAITGVSIEIYPAEREGGYKNTNFFLPERFALFETTAQNTSFYLYRVLYLSIQMDLQLNYMSEQEHTLEEARENALDTSEMVLAELFHQFPMVEPVHDALLELFQKKASEKMKADYTFLYGKWMQNDPEVTKKKALQNISEKVKTAIQDEINTILKANAVEEIVSLEIDKKAQEDYVLTHNFEKVETAEEWEGGWRDFDGDDDLDEHANALEDLHMKNTVRVDDPTHSIYQAEFIENTTISESAEILTEAQYFSYDEWDYNKRTYKPNFCKVYPKIQAETNSDYYKQTLKLHTSTLMGVRKMLTSVNNKYRQQRRQTDGEELDLDAVTDLFVDVHSGHTPSDKIYLSKRKKEKDLSILILLDSSLSSDGYAAGNKVIDVEKQVSIIFGEILVEFKVDFSIDCFYSKTRNHSTYITLKGFDEEWNKAKHRVGAVEPCGYTRIGTALRHSGALLESRNSKNKWVILLSDGKPNDYDKYEGTYGIQDVKQALRELNQQGINSYALAIEAQAKYYLPQMFGQNHYQVLTTPVALLEALVKLYDKIKHQN